MVDRLKDTPTSLPENSAGVEPLVPASDEPSLRKGGQIRALRPQLLVKLASNLPPTRKLHWLRDPSPSVSDKSLSEKSRALRSESLVKLAQDLRPLRKSQQLGMLDWIRDPSYKAPEPREVEDISVEEEYVAVLALATGKYSKKGLKHHGDGEIAIAGFSKMVVRPQWGISGTLDNAGEMRSTLRETSELVRSLRLGAARVYARWLNDPNPNMDLEGLPDFHKWVRKEYPDTSNQEVLGILLRDPGVMGRRYPIADKTAGFLPVPEGELVKDEPIVETPLEIYLSSALSGNDSTVRGVWAQKSPESFAASVPSELNRPAARRNKILKSTIPQPPRSDVINQAPARSEAESADRQIAAISESAGVTSNAQLSDAEILKGLRSFYTGEQIAYVGRVIQIDPKTKDFRYSEIDEVARVMGVSEPNLSKTADRLNGSLRHEVAREERGNEISGSAVLLFDWVRRQDERFALLTNKEVAALVDMQLGISEVEVIAKKRSV